MQNCKIKRVLVPYASLREFKSHELIELFESVLPYKGFVYINNGIKYTNYNPELKYNTSKDYKFIRFTPQQFLKHYLK